MTIELRLTDIDPPTAEPARTIYHDIASLPNPVIQGITIRYFNYDDSSLYMQITGSGTGYTFTPVNLGLLASGANAYRNLDNFVSRAKPTAAQLPNGEMSENITLTLKAYTDAGYTILKWTFDRVVTIIWINSADAAFTVNFLDNFDDGTVQGWSAVNDDTINCSGTSSATVAAAADYVLSPPFSLKHTMYCQTGSGTLSHIEKSFTTPNKSAVYAIIDIRGLTDNWMNAYKILKDLTVLVQIGVDVYSTTATAPEQKWLRIVVPLPSNTTVLLKIQIRTRTNATGRTVYLWLDDFKIVSK
jgi:hypothetical protein